MTREEALAILDTIPTIGEQVDALEMAIEALQERKTGKWEVYMDGFANLLRCTAEGCGASVNITEACHLQYYKKNFRYCPFCGAKMEVD